MIFRSYIPDDGVAYKYNYHLWTALILNEIESQEFLMNEQRESVAVARNFSKDL